MALSYFRLADGSVVQTNNPEYWIKEGKRLSAKEGKAAVAQESIDILRDMLKPGDTVHTILRHVSASGMSRRISTIIVSEGRIRDITNVVADACGYTLGQNPGLPVNGGGMDMGFHVVYGLGATLWPNGTPEPHGRRNGQPDTAGGYALKHEWL